jgi:hypothetical protein
MNLLKSLTTKYKNREQVVAEHDFKFTTELEDVRISFLKEHVPLWLKEHLKKNGYDLNDKNVEMDSGITFDRISIDWFADIEARKYGIKSIIPIVTSVSVSGSVEIYHKDDKNEEPSYVEFDLTLPSDAYDTKIRGSSSSRNLGLAPVEVDNHEGQLEIVF